jgi:hypothetical protein
VITQHVKNIRTLTQKQYESLARVWEIEGEEFSQPGPSHQNPNAAKAEGNANHKTRTRLRRQNPNESEEEDFPSSQDQIRRSDQDARVAEAEGAVSERPQGESTRTVAPEQVQNTQENDLVENQEVERPGSTNNHAQDNQVTTKGKKKKVNYRTEGAHTRSKSKKAAMVSLETEMCFFHGTRGSKKLTVKQ